MENPPPFETISKNVSLPLMSPWIALALFSLSLATAASGRLDAGESRLYEAAIIFDPEDFRLADGRASHNHSPSIVETPGGDLIACWFHGRGEREDNTMVVMGARKKKGSSRWSEPFVMANHRNLPDQNPVLFIDPQERLWLFRASTLDNEKRGHFLTYLISTDYEGDGPPRWTWQAPLFCFPQDLEQTYVGALDRLMAGGLIPEKRLEEFAKTREIARDKLWHRLGWTPRSPPIMLTENRMMLGLTSGVWDSSLIAFTEDGGETWEFSKPMIFSRSLLARAIQPSLVRKKNGNIVAFMRARDRSAVQRAESSDGGMTWEEDPLDIPCPDSSVAVLGLKSGNWLLAVNDANGRHVLSVYLSDDEGKTWKWRRSLERFEQGKGSGQYPTLIEAADGSIHVVYTHTDVARFDRPTDTRSHRTIKHGRFNEAWVKAGN